MTTFLVRKYISDVKNNIFPMLFKNVYFHRGRRFKVTVPRIPLIFFFQCSNATGVRPGCEIRSRCNLLKNHGTTNYLTRNPFLKKVTPEYEIKNDFWLMKTPVHLDWQRMHLRRSENYPPPLSLHLVSIEIVRFRKSECHKKKIRQENEMPPVFRFKTRLPCRY